VKIAYFLLLIVLSSEVLWAVNDQTQTNESFGLNPSSCPSRPKPSLSFKQIESRYQAALRKLREEGIADPERIADLRAPRFVGFSRWMRERERNHFNPWTIYPPFPKTWQGWEDGVTYIEKTGGQAFSNEWLQKLHKTTMTGTLGDAGRFREREEIGMALSKPGSITQTQIENLNNGGKKYSRDSENPLYLYQWHSRVCFEDLDQDTRDRLNDYYQTEKVWDVNSWPASQTFFNDSNAEAPKQCGFISYAKPERVKVEMQSWMNDANHFVAMAAVSKNSNPKDFFQDLARLERR
jgi:hypothetical protein